MKRVLSALLTLLLLAFCYGNTAQAEPKKIEIIETTRIEPKYDVIKLLENEVRYTKHWDEDTSDNTLQFSYDDAQILLRIAAAEASSQGVQGMLLVMETVINRVNSPDYPNTIKEVVFQPYQFQPVQDGSYYTVDIPVEAHIALAMLESNKDLNTDVIAFEATWNDQSLLRFYDLAFTYQGHTFYTTKND